MNKSLFFSCVISFLYASSVQAQPVTPAAILEQIPKPPLSVNEALRRCPGEEDTVVQAQILLVNELSVNEQKLIARDSVMQIRDHTKGTLTTTERNRIAALRREVDNTAATLTSRLERMTAIPSQTLLGGIQLIGEDLDKDIRNCPKVSEKQILDSVCIETAESNAHRKRVDRSEQFLQSVNNEWAVMLQDVLQSTHTQQQRIDKVISLTKKARIRYRLSKIRNSLWYNVTAILKATHNVTKLAVQFSR